MKAGVSLLAAAAASAMLVSPAFASAATASSFGQYSSWSKAQHAAHFTLKHPSTTFGLKRNGKIIVSQCVISGKLKDKVVDAQYGSFTKHAVGLEQDNAGVPCSVAPTSASLGSYKVEGVTAHLHGFCGSETPYSCSSTKIELWLSWKRGGHCYTASSFNESRSRLVHFARTLKKV